MSPDSSSRLTLSRSAFSRYKRVERQERILELQHCECAAHTSVRTCGKWQELDVDSVLVCQFEKVSDLLAALHPHHPPAGRSTPRRE